MLRLSFVDPDPQRTLQTARVIDLPPLPLRRSINWSVGEWAGRFVSNLTKVIACAAIHVEVDQAGSEGGYR
jgi:hypothetical protein